MYTFRAVTDKDVDGIIKLIPNRETLFRVYPNGQHPFCAAQLQQLAQERKELTVVETEGQIIGFANLYNFKTEKSAFIGNLVVAEAQRGKGVGKALLLHMMNIAAEKYKLQDLHLSVFSDNTPALLLYTSFEFSPYEMMTTQKV